MEEELEIDSCCSTPYASAPSSPGRTTGFYYSAPTSPVHFVLSKIANLESRSSIAGESNGSFEFDFSSTLPSDGASASADELFFNGQIRPMKLLSPLVESDDVVEDDRECNRGREPMFRAGSIRRRTRSTSPMRNSFRSDEHCHREDEIGVIEHEDLPNYTNNREVEEEEDLKDSSEPTPSASRSSSAGRSSKRWIFLKEFLYRSKSEGRNHNNSNNNNNNDGHKFWSSISFSPVKDKKTTPDVKVKETTASVKPEVKKRTLIKNGIGKRRGPSPSHHELHYTANRAQSEEMRKKTFLPYRQGLLGCLGFNSKSYGALNGFARALNPVSSR